MKIAPTSARFARSLEPLENRIAPAFATVLDLSSLTGPNGFQFHLAGYTEIAFTLTHVAGDVNGDGFDDLIISAHDDRTSNNGSGVSYVIFGHGGAFPATFEVSNLDGTNGFTR